MYPSSFLIVVYLVFLSLLFLSSASSPRQCPTVKKCLRNLNKGKSCQLFPLLPDAVPPSPGEKGYILKKVRPGLFHYSDDIYHSVLAYGRRSRTLVVVDFPRSQGSFRPDGQGGQVYLLVRAALEVIGNKASPKKIYMVYGHRHLDHIGSAAIFYSAITSFYPGAKVSVIGTSETRRYLIRRPNTTSRPPLPTHFLSRSRDTVIGLSNILSLQLRVVGGHTDSDVLVFVPPSNAKAYEGFVHVADIVETKNAPFAEFTFTTDIQAYIDAIKHILELDFDVFSSGHGKLGDKLDVRIALQITMDVFEAARTATQTTDISDIIARTVDPTDSAFRNNAWSFYAIIVRQAAQCTKSIVRNWGCRLSSVDVFAESLCRTAVTSVIIEE